MRHQILSNFQFSVQKFSDIFHHCKACGKHWKTKQDFLKDRQISLSTYKLIQSDDDSNSASGGVLVFVHRTRSCGKFLRVSTNEFQNRMENSQLSKIR